MRSYVYTYRSSFVSEYRISTKRLFGTTIASLSNNDFSRKNQSESTNDKEDLAKKPSEAFIKERIPPSWMHGDLATPRKDRIRKDPMRDRFRPDDYDEDVDGPRNGSGKINLSTGEVDTSSSNNVRRPPPRPDNSKSFGHESGSGGGRPDVGHTSAEDMPFNTENYHSKTTPEDEKYFERSESISGQASDIFNRAGQSGARNRFRNSFSQSKMRQYAQQGYDWLEVIAKQSPHANARELKNNIIILALAIAGSIVFLYWFCAYKTITLTTDLFRKEFTYLPPLPSDLAYFQTKWPWSLFVFPWTAPSRSLLVVKEIEHTPNFDVTGHPVAAPTENHNLSVNINPLYISNHLYRSPRDYVVQIHKDPITGQNVDKRVTYNRFFYRCIPFLIERETPMLVDLRQYANPKLFQKELISASGFKNEEERNIETQHSGLPDTYPLTKRPVVPKTPVEYGNDSAEKEVETSSKAPKHSQLYLKFRIRHRRDFPHENGAGPFVNSAIENSIQAVFQKYYYQAVLRKNAGNQKNSTLVKRMVETGVVNGENVEISDIFADGRNETFITDVLNEVVLRVSDKAIIVEKSAVLI